MASSDRDRNDRRDFDKEAQKKKIDVVDIERHGQSIIIPESLDLRRTIEVLELKADEPVAE